MTQLTGEKIKNAGVKGVDAAKGADAGAGPDAAGKEVPEKTGTQAVASKQSQSASCFPCLSDIFNGRNEKMLKAQKEELQRLFDEAQKQVEEEKQKRLELEEQKAAACKLAQSLEKQVQPAGAIGTIVRGIVNTPARVRSRRNLEAVLQEDIAASESALEQLQAECKHLDSKLLEPVEKPIEAGLPSRSFGTQSMKFLTRSETPARQRDTRREIQDLQQDLQATREEAWSERERQKQAHMEAVQHKASAAALDVQKRNLQRANWGLDAQVSTIMEGPESRGRLRNMMRNPQTDLEKQEKVKGYMTKLETTQKKVAETQEMVRSLQAKVSQRDLLSAR